MNVKGFLIIFFYAINLNSNEVEFENSIRCINTTITDNNHEYKYNLKRSCIGAIMGGFIGVYYMCFYFSYFPSFFSEKCNNLNLF